VDWYNGHPDHRDHRFDLHGEVAAIIGQGNVAIDIARALSEPNAELRQTDMAAHAVAALASSRIREVHIIGRRGLAQAKFTNKELREQREIAGCACEVRDDDLQLNAASQAEVADKNSLVAAKNVEILAGWTQPGPADAHPGSSSISSRVRCALRATAVSSASCSSATSCPARRSTSRPAAPGRRARCAATWSSAASAISAGRYRACRSTLHAASSRTMPDVWRARAICMPSLGLSAARRESSERTGPWPP
jgi:hypothetical protein